MARRKYFRWFIVALILGLIALIGVSFTYPVSVAQWAVDRLQKRGLYAHVVSADLFSGDLKVDMLSFQVKRKETVVQMFAKQGQISLYTLAVLLGLSHAVDLTFRNPTILIHRGKKPKNSIFVKKNKNLKLKEQLETARHFVEGIGGRLLSVGRIQIENGKLQFYDYSNPNRSIEFRVERIQTVLRGFRGKLNMEKINLSIRSKKQIFEAKIPKGQLGFDLERLLAKEPPILDLLHFENPSLRFIRLKASKEDSSLAERQRRARVRKELRDVSLQIRELRIQGGTFVMEDRSRIRRSSSLRISQIDGDFLNLKGKVKVAGLSLHRRSDRQVTEMKIPEAILELDLRGLFASRLLIPSVVLINPKIQMKLLGRKRKKKIRQPPPWLLVQKLEIKGGQYDLLLHSSFAKQKSLPDAQKAKAPEYQRLRFQKINANLMGLDARYLLARPFEGKGFGELHPYGKIEFRATKIGKKDHRFELSNIPMRAFNDFIGGKKLPLEINQGKVSVSLLFQHISKSQLKMTSTLNAHQLQAEVKRKGFGFKTFLLKMLLKRLNRYFEKHKKGYQLKAFFQMHPNDLFEHPSILFRRIGRELKQAYINAFFTKHPSLAHFRSTIEKRLYRKKKKIGIFTKLKNRLRNRKKIGLLTKLKNRLKRRKERAEQKEDEKVKKEPKEYWKRFKKRW